MAAPKQSLDKRFPDLAGDIKFNAKKLINRAVKERETGCWTVQRGSWHRQGYPMLGAYRLTDQKVIMTTGHRAIKKLQMQSDLQGYEVYHRCGNLKCINPQHLALGNHSDTMRNMVANDRHAKTRQRRKPLIRLAGLDRKNQKYTTEDKRFLRHASQAEAQQRYPNLRKDRLYSLRHNFRKEKYDWLDDPAHGGTPDK